MRYKTLKIVKISQKALACYTTYKKSARPEYFRVAHSQMGDQQLYSEVLLSPVLFEELTL